MWTLESHLGAENTCVLLEVPTDAITLAERPTEGPHFLVPDEWNLKAVWNEVRY